jgi:glycosyltransferase involved in cell wall biosynthesis
MKLSILICTLEERKHFLERLLSILNPQKTDEVEILINCDNRQKSIGQKRNELLKQASGDYITFIDDDDRISDDYVSKILNSINKSNPDVIGIHLIMTTDKIIEEKTFHSLKYRSWYDEPDPEKPWLRRYYRNPNHLNPVKREYALKVGFPEISMGEDKVYSTKLLDFLKTEEYIKEPIYYYDFVSRK